MNLVKEHVIEFIFLHKYEFLYRLGLDGILVCFCCSSLNLSPSEPITLLLKYGLYRSVEVARQPHRSECITENYFSYISTKKYAMRTQNNCLDKTVLLSTQNTCLN